RDARRRRHLRVAPLLSVRAVARRADEPRLRCAAGHPVGDELDGGAVEVGTAPWHPVPLAELALYAQLVHEEAFGGEKRVWPIVSSANGRSRTLVLAFSMRSGWRTSSTGALTVLVVLAAV